MARQNPGRLSTIATVELMPLQTEEGQRIGRIFDVRAEYDPAHPERPPVVTAITYGTLGFLERLGVRRSQPRNVRWASVVKLARDMIVVRKSGA